MSTKFDTVAEEYRKYFKACHVNELLLEPVQIAETRRAFYAGALSMFLMVQKAAEHDEDIASAMLNRFLSELTLEFTKPKK